MIIGTLHADSFEDTKHTRRGRYGHAYTESSFFSSILAPHGQCLAVPAVTTATTRPYQSLG